MYAQIGMFSLSFQKELFDYYSESIAYMCDTHEECRLLHQHFVDIDVKCGGPSTMDVPLTIETEWHKWAHTRSLNAGYFPGDSYKWELGKEVLLDNLMSIVPPLSIRPAKEAPNGLFPQSWPPVDPEEPEPDKTDAQILAALVMDDYEHRSSNDYLSPGFPVAEHLDPEQRIRQAGQWLDLSDEHMEIALTHAQVLVDEGKVQYQGVVRSPMWTGVDQHGDTVHLYPSGESPDLSEPDWEDITDAQPLTREELQEILTPNSARATPASTVNTQIAFTGTAHRLPTDLDEKKDCDVDEKSESKPEVSSSPMPMPDVGSETAASSSTVTMPVPMPPPLVPAAVAAAPSDD
eukprot:6477238-Amphidinium_carterae.1